MTRSAYTGPLAILLGFLVAMAIALALVHAARGAAPGPPRPPAECHVCYCGCVQGSDCRCEWTDR